MKAIFLLLFAMQFPILVLAQFEVQVGLNIPPVVSKSFEVISEFKKDPAYSLNLAMGYTFNTGHTGLIHNDVYDGIENRSTSGVFAKAGIKLFPSSLSGKQRQNNFFVGAFLIFSQYKQTALKREWLTNGAYSEAYIPVSTRGNTIFPAATIGFTHRLSHHINIEWGIQKSFVIRQNDYIGTKSRNYQPGAGSLESDPFIGYLQGIASIRYRLGKSK